MLKRAFRLVGAVTFGLAALWSLTWLLSSSPSVVHAELAQAPPDAPAIVAQYRPASLAAAQDCITITSDVFISDTWSAPCYRVMTTTVTIQDGVVLTIAPPLTGTRVEFMAGAQLQVFGSLQALGTPDRWITFTAASTTADKKPGDWVGIVLEENSGGDRIEHSVIEYARTGVMANNENGVHILSSTFRYNGGSHSRAGAIGGDLNLSYIANNRIFSCTNGIILAEAFWNEVLSNTIHDVDQYGLALVADAVGGSNNIIRGNEIYACGRDGLRLEDGFLNRVFSNTIYQVSSGPPGTSPGGAIYLSGQSIASVRHNYVYSNGGGSDYGAAVYVTGTADAVNNYPDIFHNVIYDEHAGAIDYADGSSPHPLMAYNALCSIPSYELRNGASASAINAPHNWWSTNAPSSGEQYIGLVNPDPWITLSLNGDTHGVVTVALRDPGGNTVPPPPERQTHLPAPDARRIELSTDWGTLSPDVVFVDDDGMATAALSPGTTPAPHRVVLTATDFCGYPVTATIGFPDLVITKTAAVAQVFAGDVLTYLISYANAGAGTATDMRITDTLPAGTAWADDSASAEGWTRLSAAPPVWSIPALPPGARGSFVLSVTVAPTACGLGLTNWVEIATSSIEPDRDDNVASAGPVEVICADLAIAKLARLDQGPPSAPITFTVAYTNNGDVAVSDAMITDWLPSDARYLADTSGLPCPACQVGAAGPLTWTIPSLSSGEGDRFTLTLSYASAECPAALVNTVAISSTIPESDPQDNWDTATYHVICDVDLVVVKDDDVGPTTDASAPLGADKQAAVDRLLQSVQKPTLHGRYGNLPYAAAQHREFVHEGDLVTYTIAVVNVGTYTATNVVLTETRPTHTDYVGYGWVPIDSSTYITTVGTLSPGEGRIVYFVVRVHDPLPFGVDNLVNLVCGGSDESDTSPEDNCNYEDTPVRGWPLRVSKRAEDCIAPGDPFEYTITYTNRMTNTTFSNVVVTDTLDPYVSVGTPADGWSCNGLICTRTISTIPPNTTGTLRLPVQLSAAFPHTLQTSITNVVEIQWGNRFTLTTVIDTGPDLSVVKNDNVGPLPLAQQARWEDMARHLLGPRSFGSLGVTQEREFVRPGERITYTILYLNDGFGPATGVVLTETLPEHTSYVGGGWTHAVGRWYTMAVGDLAPDQGGEVHFIVQVDDPFPPGVDRVINRVDIGGETPECNLDNNWSADDTPVRTNLKLYVANRQSGTVDVFNTTDFGYLTSIPVGVNPYGMATDGDHLFVADFDEPASNGSLRVVDLSSDILVASVAGVGAHPVHVAALGDNVIVAGHSGPPPITIVDAQPPWSVAAEVYLDRTLTYEFGFFGATADEGRGCVYLTKPDFGSVGIWRLCPSGAAWQLETVYPTDDAPRSVLYHPATDRVYAVFHMIDEVWVLDPESWALLERIPTGDQDPVYPGYGGHGLAALGECIFVSNYEGRSVTAVVEGSCTEGVGPGSGMPPGGPHWVYLPIVSKGPSAGPRIVTIPLSGQPEGMVARGNLLFVALSSEDAVAVIDTRTLEVSAEISVPGDCPHTVILAEGD